MHHPLEAIDAWPAYLCGVRPFGFDEAIIHFNLGHLSDFSI